MLISSINKIMDRYNYCNDKVSRLATSYPNRVTVNGEYVIFDTLPLIQTCVGTVSELHTRVVSAQELLTSIKEKIEDQAMDTLTTQELAYLSLTESDVP